ncbi:MAG: polysaccharide biosynthesis tyrosine autokinase [Proteobacteria bacterium]|nr:polysaccharide biosynthesis tyrosine autokinase [Pseudomonadota bacterium]
MNIPMQQKEMHIYDYLQILYKWRKPAIIFFFVILCTVTVSSFIMTPIYKATSRILIEREAPKFLNMQELLPVDASSTEFYQTQYKILQSRSLALKVIRFLNLSQNKIFNPNASEKISPQDKKDLERRLVGNILGNLKIEPIRNSRLVDINFENKDPELAANITNAVVNNYILQGMEWKTTTSSEAKDFLTKQIEEQRIRLEESEQALQGYKEKYGIVQLTQTTGQKESENIAMQRLSGLTSSFIQAQTARLEAESKNREVQDLLSKGASYESIPQINNSYLVQRLRENEAKLTAQVSELSQKYGEKHPRMIQLKQEIDSMRQKIKDEAKQVLSSIKNEYAIARAREASARGALEGQKTETQKLSERSIQYGVLLREVEKNRELYENILKRLKETSVTQELGTTNVRVVDVAEVPRSSARPKKMQNIMLSIIVGLFMGIGLAFFLEYLDNTIKTPDDIKKYLGVPNLAIIPAINFEEEVGEHVKQASLIVHHKPKSTISEAFRSLRTAILFSFPENPPKIILVTSIVPQEGKSFIAVNTALIMAHAGDSVLLIDADLRRPSINKLLSFDNLKGLSNIIVGEEANIRPSAIHDKLSVITSGPIPPNPAELLGSKRMEETIEKYKGLYDKIIIDSPPVSSVTDALVLSRLADGIIFVVHGGKTTKEMGMRGIGQLQGVNARVLGAVLNNIDIDKSGYYYYSHYYSHYYKNYYVEDDDKKRSINTQNKEKHISLIWAFLSKSLTGSKKDLDKDARRKS